MATQTGQSNRGKKSVYARHGGRSRKKDSIPFRVSSQKAATRRSDRKSRTSRSHFKAILKKIRVNGGESVSMGKTLSRKKAQKNRELADNSLSSLHFRKPAN
jgi:hypothetical protein